VARAAGVSPLRADRRGEAPCRLRKFHVTWRFVTAEIVAGREKFGSKRHIEEGP
jgi:hypothetical protein